MREGILGFILIGFEKELGLISKNLPQNSTQYVILRILKILLLFFPKFVQFLGI